MSTLIVKTRKITKIDVHPQADRLELLEVAGWSLIGQKGLYQVGDLGVFVPPDSLMTRELADKFGFTPYMGELNKSDPLREKFLRVKAARLRGLPSFGVFLSINKLKELGYDVPDVEDVDCAAILDIRKWEPPAEIDLSAGKCAALMGDAEKDNPQLHKFTDMENWRNYPNVFKDGERVIITEKGHGQNCVVGLISEPDEQGNIQWVWAARSHNVRRKQYIKSFKRVRKGEDSQLIAPMLETGTVYSFDGKDWRLVDENEFIYIFQEVKEVTEGVLAGTYKEVLEVSRYWKPLDIPGVRELILYVQEYYSSERIVPVCVFGELLGPGIQNLHYGVENGKIDFLPFAISVDGKYLNYDNFARFCTNYQVPRMPVLYDGPYSKEIVAQHTDGKTTIGGDHIREGCVILPAEERWDAEVGRVILKSISADYLAMKGLTNAR